jgi:hypothetical protein
MPTTISAPYLIQRAAIPTPLADPATSTLTKSLSLDYMGSAEFEFGALPSSLRFLRSAHEQGNMVIRLVPELKDGGSPLRVLSLLNDEEFNEYREELKKLRYSNPRTKEGTHFQHDYRAFREWNKTEFWWDIVNHVMWSFNKNYMNRLVRYLENSFEIVSR